MSRELYIITPWYNTFAGGAEVAARTLAEECVNRGIKVTILTTCCKSPQENWWRDSIDTKEEFVNGVRVLRFKLNTDGKEKYEQTIVKQMHHEPLTYEDKENFYRHGINSNELITYIKTIPREIPVLVMPYFQSLAYSVVVDNPNRITMIPCFHDEEQFYWEQIDEMIHKCKGLIYLSEPEKDLVINQYGLKYGKKVIESLVIGVGVEIERNLLTEIEEKPNKVDIPNEYFVYVGRKDRGKGVVELIEYHKQVISDIPIIFLGGGDNSLIPNNEKKFIDLGFVDSKIKYQIIKNAKALINLSNNESFSIVLMEAWLLGIPTIVSSKCNVTRYHCIVNEGGFYIDNANDYSKAIEYILDHPEQCKTMGKKGKEYVEKNYSWDTVISKLYKSLG